MSANPFTAAGHLFRIPDYRRLWVAGALTGMAAIFQRNFGLFLLGTGIKMIVFADDKPDLEKNPG